MPSPKLAFDRTARRKLLSGFTQLADLLTVTLGPRGRMVAVSRESSRRAPELLSKGAIIARRMFGLPDRFEAMGALLARHLAWQMEERVGDGATTAVLLARQIMVEADRLVVAGYNPMQLGRGIEAALPILLYALRSQSQPLDTPEQIIALATSITGDSGLGKLIEEVFDVVGPQGAIDVRHSYALTHDREFIRGAFWNQGWVSSYFASAGGKATVEKPYLLLTDHHLQRSDELLPIMEQIQQAGRRSLVVIATEVTGDALNLLVTNKTRGAMATLAIKAPGLGTEKSEILQDLALLCGGEAILKSTGALVENAKLEQLGQADEVQAIRSGFTLIGGKGRPAAIRQRVNDLRQQANKAPYGRDRERLQERAGKLLGGVALLKVGAATESEQEAAKARAQAAIQSVRLGLAGGIVTGGGVAYLKCIPALEKLSLPEEQAPAITILRHALCAPMAAIIRNAGGEPAPIIVQVQSAKTDCGYDVVQECLTDLRAAHVVDPLPVVETALQAAVSTALMGLTTDVLIHKPRLNRDKEVDFEP
ncbi:MAG: chaperonin GroEL [Caldilineaceae bacterium]